MVAASNVSDSSACWASTAEHPSSKIEQRAFIIIRHTLLSSVQAPRARLSSGAWLNCSSVTESKCLSTVVGA
jgi:hypothetical protein